MPIVGLGLHLLVALYFAVHAVRSGQNLYWLFILFSFPLLGSAVYFLVIYLPNSRLERGARQAVSAAAKAFDPGRELRDAQTAFEYTPTAQNRMRLAAALLDAGQAQEAASHYEACLQGPFAADLDIRLGAARAHFACHAFAQALEHLRVMRAEKPDFRAEAVALLTARSLAGLGNKHAAQAEFESAVDKFGSFESKAEFFIWAIGVAEQATASRLQIELQRETERWNRATRELNRPLLARLNAAYAAARPQG